MAVNEHEFKEKLAVDTFYPDHPNPRTESTTFAHTKKLGHEQQIPCAISGHKEKAEYHHVFCEWAYMDSVDWSIVKGIATGAITELPVLDMHTDQPTGETFPAKDSLIWIICKLAEIRGFNWSTFDYTKPETFVDSMANMLVLHEKFHRMTGHGIHNTPFPIFLFQAFPRKLGFIF